MSQRYSGLYLNTPSKPLHWLSKKCRRRDSNSQPQRPPPGSIPSLMLQTARFYARLYYHAQTRAHNLLRQKVITDWVSAIVGYILTTINIYFRKRSDYHYNIIYLKENNYILIISHLLIYYFFSCYSFKDDVFIIKILMII